MMIIIIIIIIIIVINYSNGNTDTMEKQNIFKKINYVERQLSTEGNKLIKCRALAITQLLGEKN